MDQLIRILSSFTNYEQNRDFHKGRIRVDLTRMKALCRAAGDPQRGVPCIHITGSKGKGSTVLMAASMLEALGLKTGAFTSPHLERINERIAVGGKALPDGAFIAAADEVLEVLRRNPDLESTFFEFITLTSMKAFNAAGARAAVYEVGLGGRLDATNVVEPEVSVITTVEREHCAVLGDTEAAIAREKAGIIKAGVPVVTALAPGSPAREVIEAEADRVGAPLVAPGCGLELEAGGGMLKVRMDGCVHGPISPPPPRAIQQWNAACALAAVRIFARRQGVIWRGEEAVSALSGTVLPGRFERFGERPEVILDGAHTPYSVEAALREAGSLGRADPVVVLGIAEDKDAEGVVKIAVRRSREIIFTPYGGGRALSPERLRAMADGAGKCAPSPLEALRIARGSAGPEGVVLVTGSFYLVGEMRRILTT